MQSFLEAPNVAYLRAELHRLEQRVARSWNTTSWAAKPPRELHLKRQFRNDQLVWNTFSFEFLVTWNKELLGLNETHRWSLQLVSILWGCLPSPGGFAGSGVNCVLWDIPVYLPSLACQVPQFSLSLSQSPLFGSFPFFYSIDHLLICYWL